MDRTQKISFSDAKSWVKTRLNEHSAELAIVDAKEHRYGWCFFYDSKRFIETQDDAFATQGNRPFYVTFDGYAYRIPSGFKIGDIESFIRSLQQGPREVREFRQFEARIPFALEAEANEATEDMMYCLKAHPEVFRRLEEMYGSSSELNRHANQVFELAWSSE